MKEEEIYDPNALIEYLNQNMKMEGIITSTKGIKKKKNI